MNWYRFGRLIAWIESRNHGYRQTGQIPRWQKVLLWITGPLRSRYYRYVFSNAVVIVRGDSSHNTHSC